MPKKKSPTRIPSLQHFSVLLGGTSGQIEKRIRGLSNLPPVSYMKLREQWIIDLIRLGVPLAMIEKACELLRGELNRKSNLEAVRALADYLRIYKPAKLLMIDKRYYPIGRGLLVPVNPPGVIVEGSVPKLFWPSFWKHDKFDDLTRAVFGSILERSIFRLRDYRDMPLAFVDLSAEDGSAVRVVRVFQRKDFEGLTDGELRIETDKFVEAYLRVRTTETVESVEEKKRRDADLPLFLDHPSP
ncbi:MAG: hypothetical protein HYX37_01040 [Rhizobiales bacterium]|nr:hypothetical protein [Hyphomicrobiales bacterium]